ncbi:MAG: ABC transporter substrate-binding protein [Anaerolineae bacterium]|nr:ABC transporter substrate-binding protein [Anaerolineae bacterium]NUQ05045.1 ABC transporter substrate-binding protein [Anaerolineae bacterium]
MMKRLFAVFALLLCLAVAGGISAQDAQSALIVATQLDDVITLDPGRAFETTNLVVHHATYETLLEIRPDDLVTIQPLLATGYTVSEDGLTYTFTLNADARFASGSPVTSEDVRFSWTRLKNIKGNPSFYADAVAAIDTPDAQTVVVTLSAVTPAFATIVTAPAMSILEKAVVVANGGTDAADADATDLANDWLSQNSAGSGPFVLTGWTPETEITMVRNDNYWRAPAALPAVTLRNVNDATTALQLLERGDVDIYENVDKDLAEQISANADLTLEMGQTLNLTYLALSPDATTFTTPLSNRQVRQAIAQAVDYDGIIDGLLLGYADRPASPLPIGVQGSDPAQRYERDLDAARALLAEAGYADGFDLTLYIGTGAPGGIPAETLAAKIQADLAEIGITLEINQQPTSNFLTAFRAQELPFLFSTWTPDYLDATMWSDYFSFADGGLSKRIRMDIPEIAAIAQQAAAETDAAARTALYQQYQTAHVTEAVFVPLFQPQLLYALRSSVQGFSFHPVYFLEFYTLSKG